MSLNKFTETQKGLDLALKIGCEELKANNLEIENIITENLTANGLSIMNGTLDAQDISAVIVHAERLISTNSVDSPQYLTNGEPILNSKNYIQMQGTGSSIHDHTLLETSLIPASQVGSLDGLIPIGGIETGDTIKLTCWGRMIANVGTSITLRVYVRDGTYKVMEIPIQPVGGSTFNETFKIEVSIVQLPSLISAHGIWTVYRTNPSLTTISYPFHQTNFENLKEMSNIVKLTAQWIVSAPTNQINITQYQVELLKPNPLI